MPTVRPSKKVKSYEESYYDIEKRKKKNRCVCFAVTITLETIVLLTVLILGSAYMYVYANLTPNNAHPSEDVKYYNYFDVNYQYNGFFKNYTITNQTINSITYYYGNFYFQISDITDRNIYDSSFLCEKQVTTNPSVANQYFPTRYQPYQLAQLYFHNGDPACSLNEINQMFDSYRTGAILAIIFSGMAIFFAPFFVISIFICKYGEYW